MAKQCNSSIPVVRRSGCMFLCCCYIANIEDIGTCDDAWNRSVNNGWVRASDSYCNVSRYNLANNLNGIYGRGIKPGLTFKLEGSHWKLYRGNTLVYNP
jgi:hypothetical protein